MIVPQDRLLFWVGAMVPLAALATALPEVAPAAATPLVVLLVVVLVDATRARGRLAGLRVRLPELVRLSKDREGRIDLYFENSTGLARRLRLGLALPPEFESEQADLTVDLPADAPASAAAWPCRAIRRGRYFINGCHYEVSSPLGFWAARAATPDRTEVRVYPNLMAERHNVSALFLARGGLGVHALRQIGKGRDFEKLREYLPGDSYEDVNWKTTAKRGTPVTKVFQIERTQEVYVVLDASRLSARDAQLVSERRLAARSGDTPATTVLERFVTAALILGLAAERQGDLFGLLTFSDRVGSFVRAKSGRAHFHSCREALYTLQPKSVAPDFDEVFTFIGLRLRRRALIVFLTNMDDQVLAESFVRNVHLVARRHLVLVNMIRPPAARALFSGHEVHRVDQVYQELGGHLLWSGLRETEKLLKERKVGFAALDNDRMCADLVSQYVAVKQRQAL